MAMISSHVPHALSLSCRCAGRALVRAAARPRAPLYAPGPRVTAVLHPFLHPTPQAVASRLLLHFVSHHIRIGFAQVVQYTQARLPADHLPCLSVCFLMR